MPHGQPHTPVPPQAPPTVPDPQRPPLLNRPPVPPAAPGGGGRGGGGGGKKQQLPGVRDVTEFDSEISAGVKEQLMKLLGGGGFDNLDTQQAILRGESANALRDARLRTSDISSGKGMVGSGADAASDREFGRSVLTERLKGLTDLNTRDQQFGLQKAQVGIQGAQSQQQLQQSADALGISRDTNIRGQDLQNLISKRAASVQRFGIQTNREIAADELQFRREGLEQEIVEQNRRFGLDTSSQELDEAFRRAGLAEEGRQFDVGADLEQQRTDLSELLGLREADRLDFSTMSDVQMQELMATLQMMGMQGFGG